MFELWFMAYNYSGTLHKCTFQNITQNLSLALLPALLNLPNHKKYAADVKTFYKKETKTTDRKVLS